MKKLEDTNIPTPEASSPQSDRHAHLDGIIDYGQRFLKNYYQHQKDLYQARLDSFDLIDWPGVKKTLRKQLETLPNPDDQIHHVIGWLEGTLSN